ncbi:MAG: phosphate regulon sensor protein PhoR, partial [Gemmatimonadota bacterium]|nr:phosphate regulon sensor protein PhoR [Gemmatimonadota bacterium]
MPKVWTWTLFWYGVALVAGGLVGFLYDRTTLGVLVIALGLLVWHLYNLFRLERWLATGTIAEIPDGNGVWPPVFAKVQFIKSKMKRRGKRFRKLVKELRASTEAFPDGGVILGPNHEIINYNQAARVLLGLKSRRDRGQRIENLLRYPDFVEYLNNPGDRQAVDIPSPAGGDTWLSCRLIPYGPEQTLLLIRDVSQRVKIERVRRDFVANASHELRSPLTVIMGYLDALAEEDRIPDGWKQPISVMQDQALRMRRLVEDLLQLSKLESGQSVPKDRVVDVAAMIAAARKEALALPEHPDSIAIELQSPANLLGEETELQSVVSNLVANAVRYTPPEGEITIRWTVDADGGHLAV